MIPPAETIDAAARWARIAGIMLERDDATWARIKNIDSVDELTAGLADAAAKFTALAELCAVAHARLTAP